MRTSKPGKRGPGRPRKDIQWEGISVRFLPHEKQSISGAARIRKTSQAEIIRHAAVKAAQAIIRRSELSGPA
jgi:hypothetical protein